SGGGGISCSSSSPDITNNTISGNSAYNGGGISCRENSSPQITKNNISGDSAHYNGGGISCSYSSPAITKNSISGNSASWSGGGGISCSSSSPDITNNTISGNSAYNGGGISCSSSSPAITNNTNSGNSANYGGGISCDDYSSPQIRNTIFSANNRYDIYEFDTSSDPMVSYNDFYGNPDGVYYDEGTTSYTIVSVMDSAIAECSNNIGLDPLFVGDTLSGGSWTAAPVYNSATFQTTLTDSYASWTENEHAGRLLNPDTTQNKQFVIVSNTTITLNVWDDATTIAQNSDTYMIFDYHLLLASPCIDAGYDQNVPNIDFDGEPRPMDVLGIDNNGPLAEYDIGADEYNPGVTPTPTPTASPTPTPIVLADFRATPTLTLVKCEVKFFDSSSGYPDNWDWDFGDLQKSIEQNPVHAYDAPGTYTVALTVSGPYGTDTETKKDYIVIMSLPSKSELINAILGKGNIPNGDVNGDGKLDVADLVTLINIQP
ncbi:MAG: PKD domain-containing protein, partial [Candidatus Sumerlaeota bacterium]|nr:PKD domain-containing protein [Candidatus Sumerlaeota bacterium]